MNYCFFEIYSSIRFAFMVFFAASALIVVGLSKIIALSLVGKSIDTVHEILTRKF
jgi:hypothetical protein